MIYDELKNYLTQVASPELVALFDRAVSLFDAMDMEDYMFTFDAVIGETRSGITEEVVDRLIAALDEQLDSLLKQHGVELNEDASLDIELTAMEALLLVQNWEDKQGLSMILDSERSAEEVFSELVSYLRGIQTERFLLNVASVDKALINRIRDEFACSEDEVEPVEEVQQQVDDYQKVRRFNWPCFVKFDKLVRFFGFLNHPFASYLKSFMVEHSAGLTRDTADNVYRNWAEELVTLTAISSEGLSKALPTIRENMSTITTDLNVTTKLDMMIVKILAEVNNAQG